MESRKPLGSIFLLTLSSSLCQFEIFSTDTYLHSVCNHLSITSITSSLEGSKMRSMKRQNQLITCIAQLGGI